MNQFKINITHIKILFTVFELEKSDCYSNQYGIYKILSGINDADTIKFNNIPTFGCLISYNSKKIAHYILALCRHGYIEKIYDKNTDELYLKITFLGRDTLLNYLTSRKANFKKAPSTFKKCIVHIKKEK